MSITVIRATIECDGCGKQFRVDLAPARKLNPDVFPSLYELAEDFVRGGHVHNDTGSCSVQAGMQLCPACTLVADNIGDEDHVPMRDEIAAALDRASDRAALASTEDRSATDGRG